EHRDELPDAREEGTVVHAALAAAFTATRTQWQRATRDAPAILAAGLAAADVVLSAWQGYAPLRAVARSTVREAVGALLRVAIDDDEFAFILAEQAFGGPGPDPAHAWPPLLIRDATTTLALRGTIDRIDRARANPALRVVDYKRSKSTVRSAIHAMGDT